MCVRAGMRARICQKGDDARASARWGFVFEGEGVRTCVKSVEGTWECMRWWAREVYVRGDGGVREGEKVCMRMRNAEEMNERGRSDHIDHSSRAFAAP